MCGCVEVEVEDEGVMRRRRRRRRGEENSVPIAGELCRLGGDNTSFVFLEREVGEGGKGVYFSYSRCYGLKY